MGDAFDAVGQWLTQLTVLGQVTVLLAVLLPLGGVGAFMLIGAIDFVGGRLRRWWVRPGSRDAEGQSPGRKSAFLGSGLPHGTKYSEPRRKITLKEIDENA